jgi:hypothetical protein
MMSMQTSRNAADFLEAPRATATLRLSFGPGLSGLRLLP